MTEYLLSVPTISVFHSSFWCYDRSLNFGGKLSNYILVNLCVFPIWYVQIIIIRDLLKSRWYHYMIDKNTVPRLLQTQGRDSNGGEKELDLWELSVLKSPSYHALLSSTQKVRLSWDKALFLNLRALRRRKLWCVSEAYHYKQWGERSSTEGAWIWVVHTASIPADPRWLLQHHLSQAPLTWLEQSPSCVENPSIVW